MTVNRAPIMLVHKTAGNAHTSLVFFPLLRLFNAKISVNHVFYLWHEDCQNLWVNNLIHNPLHTNVQETRSVEWNQHVSSKPVVIHSAMF